MKSPKNLILYKDFENGNLFYNMTWIMENYENEYYNKEDVESLLYESLNQLMELAVSHGFVGNLWHSFLAFLLVNNENAYSKACEIRGEVEGSVNQIVLHDFEIIKSLFDFDFGKLASYFEMDCMDAITDYQSMTGSGKIFNKRIKERINELKLKLEASTDVSGFKDAVTAFYKDFGVGKLGLHKAFRIQHREKEEVEIVPITNIAHVKLDDLVGYELAKQKLIDNTEAFVNGKQANNCLLYGDAGTGKSTSIQALVNEYADQGLRLIELYKEQYDLIPDILRQVKGRNYRFLLFLDDLSFEENETSYKYLKAVMEGGAEAPPENVRICATSNRRHLVREVWSDRGDVEHNGDIHRSDTVEEKLSLASRFGLQIFYPAPTFEEYQQIVSALSEKAGTDLSPEQLRAAAATWQVRSGSRSGRTARQFVDQLEH